MQTHSSAMLTLAAVATLSSAAMQGEKEAGLLTIQLIKRTAD
jgi:hypothetical protein